MNKTIGFAVLILIAISCSIFTEPDISDSEVYIISPPDSISSTASTQTLWWEYVPDATGYNVLIVNPAWDSVVSLIADSNVTENKFVVTLTPGEYDWGVSAYNHSSSTPFTISHITIDTSSELTNQLVVLQSPEDNYNTNKPHILFSWYPLTGANSYLFDIRYNSWQGSNVIPTYLTYSDTFSLDLKEGVYYWGVQGRNDFSSTRDRKIRGLIVDTTAPGKPNITFPKQNGDTISGTDLTLKWNRPLTSLSAIIDSVFISQDSLFGEGNYQYFITEETELSLEGFSAGYWWSYVHSFDAAGNIGGVSGVRKFYVSEE